MQRSEANKSIGRTRGNRDRCSWVQVSTSRGPQGRRRIHGYSVHGLMS